MIDEDRKKVQATRALLVQVLQKDSFIDGWLSVMGSTHLLGAEERFNSVPFSLQRLTNL